MVVLSVALGVISGATRLSEVTCAAWGMTLKYSVGIV